MSEITYRGALARSMQDAMEQSERTIIIGQGVTDFKGLFGTTLGLADRYPERVIETPIAEDSIAGICIGAALNGLYPINTHIRADFGLLIFNQMVNLAAKYRYMFGGLFEVPMLFRLIVGRSWGQGAQHSQSLQSLLGHIPGLTVIMPSSPASIIHSYKEAIFNHRGPVVSFEHRLMYELSFDEQSDHPIGLNGSRVVKEGEDVTIVATSVMVLESKRAAAHLEAMGISVEIIDLHSISNPNAEMIIRSVSKTGRLLVVDTSWNAYGVAAEVNRLINQSSSDLLRAPAISLGMQQSPCPTAKALEDLFYPDVHDIVRAVLGIVGKGIAEDKVPMKQSMTDFYKHYKGPF